MGRLGNYLRTYRRQWHFTEEEFAFLIGYESASIISRLERQERTITLRVAAACQTIFGVECKDVFPAIFESVEERVVERMRELRERLLQSEPTQRTLVKLERLREALDRMASSKQQEV
jgi:transcriptional regulator with XRE-family HTH domain